MAYPLTFHTFSLEYTTEENVNYPVSDISLEPYWILALSESQQNPVILIDGVALGQLLNVFHAWTEVKN